MHSMTEQALCTLLIAPTLEVKHQLTQGSSCTKKQVVLTRTCGENRAASCLHCCGLLSYGGLCGWQVEELVGEYESGLCSFLDGATAGKA